MHLTYWGSLSQQPPILGTVRYIHIGKVDVGLVPELVKSNTLIHNFNFNIHSRGKEPQIID